MTSVPLCPGLTVVTAISQSTGDYESIKTIETVTDKGVALRYSNEHMTQDYLTNEPAHLEKSLLHRRILIEDLKSANLYEQQFYDKMPDLAPGTTAIGTSSAVLDALKSKGEADIGIFLGMSGDVSVKRDDHPNVYDFQMIAHVSRVAPKDVMVPIRRQRCASGLARRPRRGRFLRRQDGILFSRRSSQSADSEIPLWHWFSAKR